MKIVTLASGSKGNCTLFASRTTNLLVDAGIPLAEIEEKLLILGISAKDISGILITHEHSDHIKSVARLSKKYNIPVFARAEEWQVLEKKGIILPNNLKYGFTTADFYIGDITVANCQVCHDANCCVSYAFYNCGIKASIATDLGVATKDLIEFLKGSSLVVLEANHDENLLLANPKYSIMLKRRILSNKGHLSNIASAKIIMQLVGGTNQIVLAHLSEENNNPALAYNTIKAELRKNNIEEGKNIFIDVATQHNIGNVFEIEN